MGPRLCRRGNVIEAAVGQCEQTLLQWGHVFVDVEITPCCSVGVRVSVASMGPRLCRRGNKGMVHGVATKTKDASMGPRLCRRGNNALVTAPSAGGSLQWGHVFVDVEIPVL